MYLDCVAAMTMIMIITRIKDDTTIRRFFLYQSVPGFFTVQSTETCFVSLFSSRSTNM